MKIFIKKYDDEDKDLPPTKINFVDQNNVILGYDLASQCCEDADWFISDKQENKIIERESDDLPNIDDFVFDVEFFETFEIDDENGNGVDSAVVIFRIFNKKDEERFIHLYNTHNGWYCHKFNFINKNNIIYDKKI